MADLLSLFPFPAASVAPGHVRELVGDGLLLELLTVPPGAVSEFPAAETAGTAVAETAPVATMTVGGSDRELDWGGAGWTPAGVGIARPWPVAAVPSCADSAAPQALFVATATTGEAAASADDAVGTGDPAPAAVLSAQSMAPPSSPTITLGQLGGPAIPGYGDSVEKGWQRHSVTAKYTVGTVTYTIGTAVEAIYLAGTTAAGAVTVAGTSWTTFTFAKDVAGQVVDNPAPLVTSAPIAADGKLPELDVASAAGYAGLLPTDKTWNNIEVDQQNRTLARGYVNSTGIAFSYTSENKSATLTVVTPAGAPDAISQATSTVRVNGSYSDDYYAKRWDGNRPINSIPQGFAEADITSAGTWNESTDITTTYYKVLRLR